MMYEIIFEYGYNHSHDQMSRDDKIFKRDFEISVIETGTIFLSESEIEVINNHKSILINDVEYNVLSMKLSLYQNMEKKYLFSIVNQEHLPF